MKTAPTLAELPEARRGILTLVKQRGPATLRELAEGLQVSYEGARQQVAILTRQGFLERRLERSSEVGRPRSLFGLTSAGDHLFPKRYDALTVELIDAVTARFGADGVKALLADLTEARVRQWQPRLEGKSLEEKLAALEEIYLEHDPFTRVERSSEGRLRLVERNCPYFEVAKTRPALCSLTVATLSRLLGYRVVRRERFQAGDGCCAFEVLTDRPLEKDAPFELEEAPRP